MYSYCMVYSRMYVGLMVIPACGYTLLIIISCVLITAAILTYMYVHDDCWCFLIATLYVAI